MLRRLRNILLSLKVSTPVHEQEVSVTVDDMNEGSRTTFDQKRVNELLVKLDLLEPSDTDPKK